MSRNKSETKGRGNYESKQGIRSEAKPLISPARSSARLFEVWEQIIDSLMWPFQSLVHTQKHQNILLRAWANKQAVMSVTTSLRCSPYCRCHVQGRAVIGSSVILMLTLLFLCSHLFVTKNARRAASDLYVLFHDNASVTPVACNYSFPCVAFSLHLI